VSGPRPDRAISNGLANCRVNDATHHRGAALRRRMAAAAWVCALVLLAGCGGPFPQSAVNPASDLATDLQKLFEGILWWAIGVFVLVEGALLVAIFRFRSGKGEDEERAEPRHLHGNTMLELAWTLAPALVLVFIAVPTMTTIWKVDRPTEDPNALIVEVTGHQWWWEFRYPESGVVTANELHIPVGRTVDFRLQSADVIHSFWFPRLAGKRDVIPGRENHLWFAADSVGRFTGQCAEFCGLSHALMKMEVVVSTPEDFQAWLEVQAQPAPALQAAAAQDTAADTVAVAPDSTLLRTVTEGQQMLMSKGCIACHRIDGTPAQGVLGPDLSHVGSRRTIAAGILENNHENLVRWMANPVAVKPGAKMPNLQLTDEELQTLAAYLGSLE